MTRSLIALALASSLGCAALPSLDLTFDKGVNVNICWNQDAGLPISGPIGSVANTLVACEKDDQKAESSEEDSST